MSRKITGAYSSIVNGVSEQSPTDREEGQHNEQVNFLSDKVFGLVRRRGSEYVDTTNIYSYTGEDSPEERDINNYRTFDFKVDGKEYCLIYRSSLSELFSNLPTVFCFSKEDRKFLTVYNDTNPVYQQLDAFGANALVNVGRYVYLAPRYYEAYNQIIQNPSELTITKKWDTYENFKTAVVWVVTGQYSKKYWFDIRFKDTVNNTYKSIHGEYTTMKSYFQGDLDTTAIAFSDPDYQEKVNNIVNAYVSDVNKHIGKSAADILPTNIANELLASLQADLTSKAMSSDVELDLSNTTIGIKCKQSSNYIVSMITSSDNFVNEGPAIRVVDNRVYDASSDLSSRHYVGKVVKVKPINSSDNDDYYVKAEKRYEGSTGDLVEVVWNECAGEEQEIDNSFCYATVHESNFFISGSNTGLKNLVNSNSTEQLTQVPGFIPSESGDRKSNEAPYFAGKSIDYLGMFQDRLVVGCENHLSFSRTGDYLNFFKETSLTLLDSDPVGVFSYGSLGDTIKSSATFGRDMVFFGEDQQYVINGDKPFTPKNPVISVFSKYMGTGGSKPISGSGFMFYASKNDDTASIYQIQQGNFKEKSETIDLTYNIPTYIKGNVRELLHTDSPYTIIVSSDGYKNGVYIYNYLDINNYGSDRKMSSWSRWEWDKTLGFISGMTTAGAKGLFIFTLRRNQQGDGDNWCMVSDYFSLENTMDDKPYLDSNRLYSDKDTGLVPYNGFAWGPGPDFVNTCYGIGGKDDPKIFVGIRHGEYSEYNPEAVFTDDYAGHNIYQGISFDSYVSPTNPKVTDNSGNPILASKLSVVKYDIYMKDSGGVLLSVNTDSRGEVSFGKYSGREIGWTTSQLGTQPVSTGKMSMFVARNSMEFTYKIQSYKWLPISITDIEYQCRFLYRSKRA